MENLTQKLRALRKSRGITQGELSNSTGVSVSHISAAENGKRKIADPDWQKAIADYYGVPVESIVEFSEESPEELYISEGEHEYRHGGLGGMRSVSLISCLDLLIKEKDWDGVISMATELKRRGEG